MTDKDTKTIDLEPLFDLSKMKIKKYKEDLQENGVSRITLYTELKSRPRRCCPKCDSLNVYSHGYGTREIADLPMFGKDVMVLFEYQRFKCNSCGTLFQDDISDYAMPGSSFSNRLREAIAREGARFGFTRAADRYGGSITNAKAIFNDWAEIQAQRRGQLKAPEVLGIDEAHLGTSKTDMRGVFIDVNRGLLMEITQDRNSDTVQNTIKSLDGWQNIKAVTTDMWKGYRRDVYDQFGEDFLLVVDRFHVIQDLNKKMVAARKLIVAEAGHPGLGDNADLMKVNLENLRDWQKEHLMNQFAIVPELGTLYALKESFRTIYNCKNKDEALRMYDEWCASIPEKKLRTDAEKKKNKKDRFDPIRKFKKTVDNWKREIFNWYDLQVTNAATEAINGLIKRVNSDGRGYEFETLRHKLLFGMQAANIPTETVYVSKKAGQSGRAFYSFEISPEVLDINFYPLVRKKPLTYEERVANIVKLEEALDSGELYIGPDDYPDYEEDIEYGEEDEE